jgi:hypothetical protein
MSVGVALIVNIRNPFDGKTVGHVKKSQGSRVRKTTPLFKEFIDKGVEIFQVSGTHIVNGEMKMKRGEEVVGIDSQLKLISDERFVNMSQRG